LFLILPFIILKIQGIPISLMKYFEVLKVLFKQHQIGQIFTIGSASWDKVIYIFSSFCFYILQVYQNVTSCMKYFRNMKKIHLQLFTMREYIHNSLKNISILTTSCHGLKTYQPFIDNMNEHKEVLLTMEKEFNEIVPNGFTLKKLKQIGHVMKCFYQLYNKTEYHNTLEYSFSLNGYLDNLIGLNKRLREKQVNNCKLIKNKKPTKFTDAYFPTLVDTNPVKNSYTLDKHILITGPNAAGKTTYLKTTTLNVIFTQQFGCGFYSECSIRPYTHIHSYLNIPDTSARDSLFQAESRRCKEIIEAVILSDQSTDRHFCIFDELYSGTNPEEASKSAYAFLLWLSRRNNVDFILTTHYTDICSRWKKARIANWQMDALLSDDGEISYTYKIKPGVSKVQGAIKVLRDMEYPKEILDTIGEYDSSKSKKK